MIDMPTKDKAEDTPLTLAVKNVPQTRNSSDVSIEIVKMLLGFGKLKIYVTYLVISSTILFFKGQILIVIMLREILH